MPRIGTLTIANSGTASTSLDLERVEDFTIYPPSALTGTCTLQASADGSTWMAVQSAGSDVTVTASKVMTVTKFSGDSIRINSGSAEGAERVFTVFSTDGSPR